jgi:5-methylcytosine-specific restriction endonuclease McrA
MHYVTETWREDNPWYKDRCLKIRLHQANRRAAMYGAKGTLTVDDWEYVLTQSGGICVRCGTERFLTFDHIISFAEGGSNLRENLQPLCADCHQQKSNEEHSVRMLRWWAEHKAQKGL